MCSPAVSHGSHDSMPSKIGALGQPLPLLPAPRLGADQLGGPLPDVVGGQQLPAGEQLDALDVVGRALVGDREAGEAVDLVAPQVDAHGGVGGGREHVDDRPPPGHLAPVLDLQLPPVAGLDQPGRPGRRGRRGRPG